MSFAELQAKRAEVMRAVKAALPSLGIPTVSDPNSDDAIDQVRQAINKVIVKGFRYNYDDNMPARPEAGIFGGAVEIWDTPILEFVEKVQKGQKTLGDCEDWGMTATFLAEAAGIPVNRLATLTVVSETSLQVYRSGQGDEVMDHSLGGVWISKRWYPLGDTWFEAKSNWNLPVEEDEGGWHRIFMWLSWAKGPTDWVYGPRYEKSRPLDEYIASKDKATKKDAEKMVRKVIAKSWTHPPIKK